MANPTLPTGKNMDFDDLYYEVEGIVVNDKVVVSTQQANVADISQTINTGFVRVEVDVDSTAGGTATEVAITTVPAHSIVFSVEAEVLVLMDGNATTTFEVGLTGNIDKYIDTVDFDSGAAAGTTYNNTGGTNNDQKTPYYTGSTTEAIVATWTNTAAQTTGSTRVVVHYLPLDNIDVDSVDTKINAILDILEAHGLMADA